MLRHLRLLTLAIASCFIFACGQQSIPPDIQKLIDKAATGATLTQAELAKLQAWGMKQADREIDKKASSGQSDNPFNGIPCEVTIRSTYQTYGDMDKEKYDLEATMRVRLFARINGNGDYSAGLANPNAKATTFLFQPELDPNSKTGMKAIGQGRWTRSIDSDREKIDASGSWNKATIGFMLVSTGKGDRLFVLPGSAVGAEEETGSARIREKYGEQRTQTLPLSESNLPSPVAELPFAYENAMPFNLGDPIPSNFQVQASLKQLMDAVTGKGPATVNVRETFDLGTLGTQVRGSTTISISLRPSDVILQMDPVGYKEWRPEGGRGEGADRNMLTVKVRLANKTGAPLTSAQKLIKVRFELLEVSKEPGTAINFPNESLSGSHDMIIDEIENKHLKVPQSEMTAETKEKAQFTETYVKIMSRDWGGIGKLKVTAQTTVGSLTAELKGDPSVKELLIPKRSENSWIADSWKEKNGVTDLNDYDDKEGAPKGDGDEGDGLTLYEEYRGFYANQKHYSGHPKKKDLLVMVTSYDATQKPRVHEGFQLLMDITGIVVHSGFLPEEFGKAQSNSEEPRSRIINENHDKSAHIVDQHGLDLRLMPYTQGFAGAYSNVNENLSNHLTPKGWKYILMTRDFKPGFDSQIIKLGSSTIQTNHYASTVAHELLHCLNVGHHGENDTGISKLVSDGSQTFLIQSEKDQNGNQTWKPARPVGIREDTDQGDLIIATDPRWKGAWKNEIYLYIGNQNGQHSGMEDCVMRYSAATAYFDKSGTLFLRVTAPGAATFAPEMVGIGLCTNASGTGVNMAGARPRVRYGNANLGDCAGQICISDRYFRG